MYMCLWIFFESELTKTFTMYNEYGADEMFCMLHQILCICVCENFSKVSLLRYLLCTMNMELSWQKISGQLHSQTHTQIHLHAHTCVWEFLKSELTKIFTVYNDHDIVNI